MHPARKDQRLALFCRIRSEEHTSELQSLRHLVCRLLLEKKNELEPDRSRRRLQSPVLRAVPPVRSARRGRTCRCSRSRGCLRALIVDAILDRDRRGVAADRVQLRGAARPPGSSFLLGDVPGLCSGAWVPFFSRSGPPPRSTLFPYTTLFR